MKEIWKDIKDLEGKYQVSNLGRVKALSRERVNHTGGHWVEPEKILKTRLNADGYEVISLNDFNSKRHTYSVHRLVAEAFVDNPNNKKEVNHINCNRSDNCANNLEWVSHQENVAYCSSLGNNVKRFIQCVETGEVFYNSTEVAKSKKVDSGNVRTACRLGKNVGGLHYVYINK